MESLKHLRSGGHEEMTQRPGLASVTSKSCELRVSQNEAYPFQQYTIWTLTCDNITAASGRFYLSALTCSPCLDPKDTKCNKCQPRLQKTKTSPNSVAFTP